MIYKRFFHRVGLKRKSISAPNVGNLELPRPMRGEDHVETTVRMYLVMHLTDHGIFGYQFSESRSFQGCKIHSNKLSRTLQRERYET